ncbi:unnamed protein product [Prunus armeniaca]
MNESNPFGEVHATMKLVRHMHPYPHSHPHLHQHLYPFYPSFKHQVKVPHTQTPPPPSDLPPLPHSSPKKEKLEV